MPPLRYIRWDRIVIAFQSSQIQFEMDFYTAERVWDGYLYVEIGATPLEALVNLQIAMAQYSAEFKDIAFRYVKVSR